MDNTPLVSVIIPTYKNNGSLTTAIDSVLNQTYDNIEIIVVDDNNSDSPYRTFTESLMKKYEYISYIKYIKHEVNKNGAAARNTGFINSKGDYISLLDDDDSFVPSKTKLQVDYLNSHNEFGAVYGGRYEGNNIIVYQKEGDLSKELLTYSILPCTCSLMLRKDVYKTLKGFDESYKRHQDFEFCLRLFEKFNIGVIKEPVFYRRPDNVNSIADNRLCGKELEKQKINYLIQFNSTIEAIDKLDNGFKKTVYAIHFSRVFWNYVRYLKIISAVRVLIKYSILCRGKFIKELYKYAVDYFKSTN